MITGEGHRGGRPGRLGRAGAQSDRRTRISVRVAPGLGAGHFAALVAACHRAVSEAEVGVAEQATADQIRDLIDGRADIGVLREPVAVRGLRLGPGVSVPLNALVPRTAPAATTGHVRLRDLGGHKLILPPREPAPSAHDELLSTCERHGFLPDPVHEVADERLTRGLVASGTYVSFTTDQPGGDEGTVVVPVDGEPLTVVLRLAWRGELGPLSGPLPAALVSALVRRAPGGRRPPAHRPRAISELPTEYESSTRAAP